MVLVRLEVGFAAVAQVGVAVLVSAAALVERTPTGLAVRGGVDVSAVAVLSGDPAPAAVGLVVGEVDLAAVCRQAVAVGVGRGAALHLTHAGHAFGQAVGDVAPVA